LRQARKKRRLTQIEVARRAQLSPESICRFEKLRRPASMDAAKRIAKVLNVPVTTLISGPPVRVTRAERTARTELTCKMCGVTKPLAGFIRIKQTLTGYYGRCRQCRAARAKERYWADPRERERRKAQGARYRQRRRLARIGANRDFAQERASSAALEVTVLAR